MKKFLVMLMFVISMVGFGRETITAMGEDKYSKNDFKHPTVAVIYNDRNDTYTVVRFTAANGFAVELNEEFDRSLFKQSVYGFDAKHPDGYDTGIKIAVYMKHKGNVYKNVSYEVVRKLLKEIDFIPYI